MTGFKMVYNYFHDAGEFRNRLDMAEALDVSARTIDNWCDNGFPIRKSKLSPLSIFAMLFFKEKYINGFLCYIEQQGLTIREEYKASEQFVLFFDSFLKSRDIYKDFGGSRHILTLPSLKLATNQHHTTENVVEDEDYFCQKIYSKKNDAETFNVSTPDFSYFESNNRILIEGPGGQGKSTFLGKTSGKALSSDNYSAAIVIKLLDLVSLDEEDLIPNYNQRCENIRYIASYFYKLFDKKLISEEVWDYVKNNKPIRKPILLSLDGLNELFCSSNTSAVFSISNEIKYITDEWDKAQIILTTRLSENEFNYNNLEYITKYEVNYLSGVPKEKYDEFIEKNPSLDDSIKDLAKIPLYFNTLSTLKDTSKLKSKYDAIFEVYNARCKQNIKIFDENTFFAFYILSPFVAQKISKKSANMIEEKEIDEIISSMQQIYPNKLVEVAKRECKNFIFFPHADMNKVRNILFNYGPLIHSGKGYRFFHDEVRDFLCCFATIISTKSIQEFSKEDALYNKSNYDEIFSINVDFNLTDEPTNLLKYHFNLTEKTTLSETVSNLYSFGNNVLVTPELILYAHTAFLISDYLYLGESILEPIHNSLLNFTNSVFAYFDEGILEDVFNGLTSEQQKIRCKKCLSNIISKHCEYFRRNGEFEKCLMFSSYAEKIYPNTDEIKNQKAKCLIAIHRDHILNNASFSIENYGFSNYSEVFKEGFRLLEETANNDFNLSVNLYTMMQSVPAPYLFDDKNIGFGVDYISAFMRNYNMIFTNKHNDYTIKEIAYTVRQSVGLLLKGYVKVSPKISYIQGRPLGRNSIVLGDRNTLKLNSQTIELVKYLLRFVEGMSMNTLNYYRGIIAYYDKDYEKAEALFNDEKDILLKTIFLKYWKNPDADISHVYKIIKDKFNKAELNAADKCHPIYWYIDIKNLEVSFGKKNKEFFDDFEKELPKKCQNIIAQLTL